MNQMEKLAVEHLIQKHDDSCGPTSVAAIINYLFPAHRTSEGELHGYKPDGERGALGITMSYIVHRFASDRGLPISTMLYTAPGLLVQVAGNYADRMGETPITRKLAEYSNGGNPVALFEHLLADDSANAYHGIARRGLDVIRNGGRIHFVDARPLIGWNDAVSLIKSSIPFMASTSNSQHWQNIVGYSKEFDTLFSKEEALLLHDPDSQEAEYHPFIKRFWDPAEVLVIRKQE